MKIGIITFWWGTDNYGEQLQIYALQHYLKENGYDAFLIRYDMRGDIPSDTSLWKKAYKALNPVKLINFVSYKLKEHKQSFIDAYHPRYFDEFRNDCLKMTQIYSSFAELQANPPEADIYLAGSDQIWNPDCAMNDLKKCSNIIRAFFLDFGDKNVKKISYAASWGKKVITYEWSSFVNPLLNKFSFVTVREKSGIDICRQCGYGKNEIHDDPRWVCDPTLLLEPEDYRSIYQSYISSNDSENVTTSEKENHNLVINHSEEKYIFFYYLDNGGKFDIDSVYSFAKKRNLKVLYIKANGQVDKYETIYPNLPQWLELMDHATYVVTNSFHCSVFSIIFHKQFAAIPITGIAAGMNERLSSLFELCSMEFRFISCENDIIDLSVLDKQYTADINNSGGKLLLGELKKYKSEK
jgi:hypothetical protein